MEHYKLVDDVQKSSAFRQFLENKKCQCLKSTEFITGMGPVVPSGRLCIARLFEKQF